jgi:hypothetical protein
VAVFADFYFFRLTGRCFYSLLIPYLISKTCYPPSLYWAGPCVARVSEHLEQGGKGRSRPPGLCQTNQGHLWVDLQCQAKYPGHGQGNTPVQPDPQHLTLGPVEVPWQRRRLYPGRAYKKPPRNSGKVTAETHLGGFLLEPEGSYPILRSVL